MFFPVDYFYIFKFLLLIGWDIRAIVLRALLGSMNFQFLMKITLLSSPRLQASAVCAIAQNTNNFNIQANHLRRTRVTILLFWGASFCSHIFLISSREFIFVLLLFFLETLVQRLSSVCLSFEMFFGFIFLLY